MNPLFIRHSTQHIYGREKVLCKYNCCATKHAALSYYICYFVCLYISLYYSTFFFVFEKQNKPYTRNVRIITLWGRIHQPIYV